MRLLFKFCIILSGMAMFSCTHDGFKKDIIKGEADVTNVLFLHHSTGRNIYNGKMTGGIPTVENWFNQYNSEKLKINFVENIFPQSKKLKVFGYGWKNYPYDYYNIWVKHGNNKQYKGEPTLRVLAPLWDVIVLKHCFPVSYVSEIEEADIDSEGRTLENYKLQYNALKLKFHEYPNTKFILWTGAALVEKHTNRNKAEIAKEFFEWVKNEWDVPNDNIYLWDFYELETEGGLYLKEEYAISETNSHPNVEFSEKVGPLLCERIIDVIENNGEKTNLLGVRK